MSRSTLILRLGVETLFTTVLAFSLFFLFVGHNAPGGGFIGGLVAAAALVLRFLAFGGDSVRQAARVPAPVYLGLGLVIAGVTGTAGLVLGSHFLESGHTELDVPLLGHVSVTSSLVFDIGVYLIVVGFALMLLDVMGADPVPPENEEEAPVEVRRT